ncbi:MAG: lysozyme inhibitor LprI family protein [Betaproteobacteria bacterium]
MNRTWVTLLLLLGAAVTAPATAGALDECQTAGDHAAVTRCLFEADAEAQASLRNAEGVAGTRARELDTATGRAGANAALAKSLRAFLEYRTMQCNYVKALYASGNGAEQAGLACRVDLTRRRVRELQP